MGFLFTEENQNLRKHKEAWLAGEKWGAYVLAGKSGSGKTAFLQHLDMEWKSMCQRKMITWMRVEELIALLVQKEDVFVDVSTPILILENMEELIGKDNTLSLFWRLLEEWLQDEQHLFIGVTNSDNIGIPSYVEVVQNQAIAITPSVVSYVADMQDIKLSKKRIVALCSETEGSISKLIGLVKQERLFV